MPDTLATYGADYAGTGLAAALNPVGSIMDAGRYHCAMVTQESELAASTGVPVLTPALAAYDAGPNAAAVAGGNPRCLRPRPTRQRRGAGGDPGGPAAGVGGRPGGAHAIKVSPGPGYWRPPAHLWPESGIEVAERGRTVRV